MGTAEWIGLTGSMIALAALAVAWLAFRQDKTVVLPKLTIEKVELSTKKDIQAFDKVDPGVWSEAQGAFRQNDATIEITLGNSGGTSALIEVAVADFQLIGQLANCPGGAGPITTTYEFDILVPLSTDTPLTIEHRLAFEVPAGRFDQLALTVGPQEETEGEYPWLYLLTVSLKTSTGETVTTPSVAILSSVYKLERVIDDLYGLTPSQELDPFMEERRQCQLNNLRELRRIITDADQVSPQLQMVFDRYITVLGPA